MAELYHQDIVDIELNTGNIHRSFLKHSIGSGDEDANRFGVRVYRDGNPVNLTGASCQGYFRNSQGQNIALTSHGTVSGNVAYITLPQACYNYEGQFCLAIKLVGGGVTGTMRIVDGMVDNTNTGSAVAPTSSVPTYQEILALYDEMQAATVTAETVAPKTKVMAGSREAEMTFEFGTFKDADGVTKDTNAKRIRCQKIISMDNLAGIIIPDGYSAYVFMLDSELNKVGAFHSTWQTGSVYAKSILTENANTRYINVVFKSSTSDDNLTNDDLEAIEEGFVVARLNDSPLFCNLFGGEDDIYYPVSFETGDTIIMTVDVALTEDEEVNFYDKDFNRLEYWNFRSGYYTRTVTAAHDGIRYVKIGYNSPLAKKNGRNFQVGMGLRPATGAPKREILKAAEGVEFPNSYKIARFRENATPYRKGNTSGAWYDRFVLMHISDVHVSTNSPIARGKLRDVIAAANAIKPDVVVDSGDMSVGGEQTRAKTKNDLALYTELTTEALDNSIPIVATLGNHDANDVVHNYPTDFYERATTKQDQWDQVFDAIADKYSQIVWGDSANHKGYHYIDITKSGYTLRIIVLDGLDHADYTSSSVSYDGHRNEVYSQNQINWLIDILSPKTAQRPYGIDENYGVIIVNHFPFAPYRASGYSEEWPALNDGMFTQGWSMIPEIVKAWQDRTSISKTFTDAAQEGDGTTLPGLNNITVSADFSQVDESALFVCFICGHTHSKNVFTVKQEGGTNFGQVMLVEDSNRYQGAALSRVVKTDENGIGITTNAASQIAIDMETRKIYRTAYGVYMRCDENNTPVTEIISF